MNRTLFNKSVVPGLWRAPVLAGSLGYSPLA